MAKPKEKEPGLISRIIIWLKHRDKAPNNELYTLPDTSNFEWYKIKANEKLEDIANAHGWRLEDLFIYNWRTIDLEEVNWYLRKYVGCKDHKDGAYIFTGTEKPGKVLVPTNVRGFLKKPDTTVNQPLNGDAKIDLKLQVKVFEALPGFNQVIAGKWLYVFSANGIDFGYEPPPQLLRNREAASEDSQPGSGFRPDFPGIYHLKEKPDKKIDKLEHEIYISGKEATDEDAKMFVAGDIKKSKLKYPSRWYTCDAADLEKATTESRDNRGNYTLSEFRTIPIDLAPNGQNRRFYFLLSPVKLGPEAIKYAMEHPNGLTPLLKHNAQSGKTDYDDSDENDEALHEAFPGFDPTILRQNLGPKPEDKPQNPITVFVIDPYEWALHIAAENLPARIAEYNDWFKSNSKTSKYETVEYLKKKTGWSLDHLYVAEVVQSMLENYARKDKLYKELKDWVAMTTNLTIWRMQLTAQNGAVLASLHYTLMQLISWLENPAHKIIETAILKDTNYDDLTDAPTIRHGIWHWAVIIENIFTLEPGVAYLSKVLNESGTVVYDLLLKYIDEFIDASSPPNVKIAISDGWRLAELNFLQIAILRDFVDFKSPVDFSGNEQDDRARLIEHLTKKRDKLIKLLNDHKILPGEVQGLPLDFLSFKTSPDLSLANILTALTTTLDFVDKGFNAVAYRKLEKTKANLEKNSQFKDPTVNKGHIDVDLYTISDEKYKRAFWRVKKVGYVYKTAVFGVGVFNFVNLVRTLGDEKKTTLDWLNNTSSLIVSAVDGLVELAEVLKIQGKENAFLSKTFPTLIEMKKPGLVPYYQAVKLPGIGAGVIAGINLAALIITGVATVKSMNEQRQKALNLGDYTAATWYNLGAKGGYMQVAGAAAWGLALGFALMEGGAAAAGSIFFASVGVVLMLIGAIITLIASIFGNSEVSDDYEIFVRRCFLGKEGDKKPSFGNDPPPWSHAPKDGKWTIGMQKKALLNLLGRFLVEIMEDFNVSPDKLRSLDQDKGTYQGNLTYIIDPGLILPGTTVEVELYYESGSQKSSATLQWIGPTNISNISNTSKYALIKSAGTLFSAEKTSASFKYSGDRVTKIYIWLKDVHFNKINGADITNLLTDVSVRYPGISESIIRSHKRAMVFDENTQQSGRGQKSYYVLTYDPKSADKKEEEKYKIFFD